MNGFVAAAVAIVSGAAVVILGTAAIAADALFRIAIDRRGRINKNKPELSDAQKVCIEWFNGMTPESVSVKSRDGLTLRGKLLRCPNAKRTIITVHGYRSYGLFDFSPILPFYYSQKCNLLVIDQRACGESEGKYIGFGLLERFDLLKWIALVNDNFGELPLYLHGISLGGATVLMASSLELPANVKGIIDDCGYSSAGKILRRVLKQWFKLPPFPLYYIAKLFIWLHAGYDPDSYSAPEALSAAKLSVLMIHGSADDFVPIGMSRENFAACVSEKKLIIVNGAAHAESYYIEPDRINGELKEFFSKYDTINI